MKKTVLFLIAVICFMSIFVVALFGTKASVDQFKVYINSVEITSFQNKNNYLEVGKQLDLTFDDKSEIGASYFISYKIGPSNATNKSNIEFSIDDIDTEKDDNGKVFCYKTLRGERVLVATIDQKGEVCFFRRGYIYFTLTSKDGIPASDRLLINCI